MGWVPTAMPQAGLAAATPHGRTLAKDEVAWGRVVYVWRSAVEARLGAHTGLVWLMMTLAISAAQAHFCIFLPQLGHHLAAAAQHRTGVLLPAWAPDEVGGRSSRAGHRALHPLHSSPAPRTDGVTSTPGGHSPPSHYHNRRGRGSFSPFIAATANAMASVLASETSSEATCLWLTRSYDACQQTLQKLESIAPKDVKASMHAPEHATRRRRRRRASGSAFLRVPGPDRLCPATDGGMAVRACTQISHNLAVVDFMCGDGPDEGRLLEQLGAIAVRGQACGWACHGPSGVRMSSWDTAAVAAERS